jgi:hypothetical protein
VEIDEKIAAEALQEEPTPAEPPPPLGRPWVKGQSGNPRGRPSRAHKAAYVAHAMFDR